jgi:hypothetical protein
MQSPFTHTYCNVPSNKALHNSAKRSELRNAKLLTICHWLATCNHSGLKGLNHCSYLFVTERATLYIILQIQFLPYSQSTARPLYTPTGQWFIGKWSLCEQNAESLGMFAKRRNATVSFVMFVGLSVWLFVRPHGTVRLPLYRYSKNLIFDIWLFFENLPRRFQVSLKSDQNNGYFTWRPINIFDHIGLSSS